MILFCFHSPMCIGDALQEVQNWVDCGMPRHNGSGEQKHLTQVTKTPQSWLVRTSCSSKEGTCVLVPGKAIWNHHSANPCCTRLAGWNYLTTHFYFCPTLCNLFATAVMRAAPFPLPSSESMKLTSHWGASSFTVSCRILEKLEGKGKKNRIFKQLLSELRSLYSPIMQGTSAIAFFCFFSYSWKIQISVHNQILIFISLLEFCSAWCHTLPTSSEIMKEALFSQLKS